MSMCETAARFTCTIWEGPRVVPSVTVVTRDIVSFYICYSFLLTLYLVIFYLFCFILFIEIVIIFFSSLMPLLKQSVKNKKKPLERE